MGETGIWTFITKEIFGEFPNWKQAVPIPGSNWTRVNLSDEAIKQLVLVTPNLPGEGGLNQPVRLRITGEQLMVEGRNRDDEDWTSIPVDAVVKGKPITVALSRSKNCFRLSEQMPVGSSALASTPVPSSTITRAGLRR